MDNINIERLSLEELIELNHKIVKRIREFNKIKLSQKLQSFQIGEQVSFKNEENTVTGTIIRVNQVGFQPKNINH